MLLYLKCLLSIKETLNKPRRKPIQTEASGTGLTFHICSFIYLYMNINNQTYSFFPYSNVIHEKGRFSLNPVYLCISPFCILFSQPTYFLFLEPFTHTLPFIPLLIKPSPNRALGYKGCPHRSFGWQMLQSPCIYSVMSLLSVCHWTRHTYTA